MRKTKRNYLIVALIIILLSLTIGYAAFSDVLTISGTANAKGTFDMIFESASIDLDSAQGIDKVNSKATVSSDANSVNVNIVDLAYPGAGTNVTVVIKNNGNVDAELKELILSEVDKDIEVGYPEGFQVDQVVPAGKTCKLTFYVKWVKTSEVTEKSVNFSASLKYEQLSTEFTGSADYSVDA